MGCVKINNVKACTGVIDMDNEKSPVSRLGNFAKSREKIIEEYSSGNYLKTSADLAMEEEACRKEQKDDHDK